MKAKKRIEDAERQIAESQAFIKKLRSSRRILCACGHKHAIKTLTLLVTHWYIEPHGCTGGDYWKEGEWQFLCPKLGTRNRLLFSDYDVVYEERQTIGIAAEPTFKHLYRGLFKETKNVNDGHGDWEKAPSFNNVYVNQHRKHFELPEKKR